MLWLTLRSHGMDAAVRWAGEKGWAPDVVKTRAELLQACVSMLVDVDSFRFRPGELAQLRGHHDVGEPRGIRLVAHGVDREFEPQGAEGHGPVDGGGPVALAGDHRVGLTVEEAADPLGLPAGDRVDHRDEHIFARSEVVVQHSLAGTDGRGQGAQAGVSYAVLGVVEDNPGQQVLTR